MGKPWRKGESGNPKGRPKNPSFREWVDSERPELKKLWEKAIVKKIKAGDSRILAWFGDQYNGKAPQPIIGDPKHPVTIQIIQDVPK